jgi:2-keto-4-pentenoate hydratase
MGGKFDPDPAAKMLADAWRDGRQLIELPLEARPQTLDEGYDLQDAVIALLREPTAGWKLGVGSRAGMRMTGLGKPLMGRVLASHRYANGDTVRLPHRLPVTYEFEIAFVLGRDIAPGESLAAPLDAVAEMRTTFELVVSRFVNRRAVGWPSFTGDSVGFEALVVGNTIQPGQIAEVGHSVVISVDGKETARGLTGDDLTDPIASFGQLIAHAKARAITLRRGEIATLGVIGKPFDAAGDVEVVARYLDTELRFKTVAP